MSSTFVTTCKQSTATIHLRPNMIFDTFYTLNTEKHVSAGIVFLSFFLLSILVRALRPKPSKGNRENTKVSHEQDPLGSDSIVPTKGLPTSHQPDWPRYWKPGKFQMTMAQRKLDINNWFNYDHLFDKEHAAKIAMAKASDSENYVDYLDGIDEAVLELLEIIVTYVVKRYPDMFRTDGEYIYIDHLNEKYRIQAPFDLHPLTVCGLIVMDDLYVLKKGANNIFTL